MNGHFLSQLLLLTFSIFSSHRIINSNQLKRAISNGQVFYLENWLPASTVNSLRDACFTLNEYGLFKSSGLSYAKQNVIVNGETIPNDTESVIIDRLVCDEIPESSEAVIGNEAMDAVRRMSSYIESLYNEVSKSLKVCRPTLSDCDLDHESYISLSPIGSVLPRHVDERHEELKPTNRYSTQSRRSISWLVYLNDITWNNENYRGGELCYFPLSRKLMPIVYGGCGSHDGNIQVGWWNFGNHSSKPVYMESWYDDLSFSIDSNSQTDLLHDSQVSSALYILTIFGRKIYLTHRFYCNPETTYSNSMNHNFYTKSCHAFKSNFNPDKFTVIEDYDKWKSGKSSFNDNHQNHNQEEYHSPTMNTTSSSIQSVVSRVIPPPLTYVKTLAPKSGTLCLFDSVSLPHEVLPVWGLSNDKDHMITISVNTSHHSIRLARVALAGWFHEAVKHPHQPHHIPPHQPQLDGTNTIKAMKQMSGSKVISNDETMHPIMNSKPSTEVNTKYQETGKDSAVIDMRKVLVVALKKDRLKKSIE